MFVTSTTNVDQPRC